MKNIIILTFCYLLSCYTIQAQSRESIDSLLKILRTVPNDSNKVHILNQLGLEYTNLKPDSAYLMSIQAYELAVNLNFSKGKTSALAVRADLYDVLGDYAKSIKLYNQLINEYTLQNNKLRIANTLNDLGVVYLNQYKWQKALESFVKGYTIYKEFMDSRPRIHPIFLVNIGETYYNIGQLDSADYYLKKAIPLSNFRYDIIGNLTFDLGDVALKRNKISQAKSYYKQSISAYRNINHHTGLCESYYRMAKLYQKESQLDSAVFFGKHALSYSQKSSYIKGELMASTLLSELYEGRNNTESLRYYKLAVKAKDSLYSQVKITQLVSIGFEEKEQSLRIEANNAEYRNSIRLYILIGILAIIVIIAVLLYKKNLLKQRANRLLQQQKEEIDQKSHQLEKSLATLKSTQAQLIQSEKLASLGELTAGIAHEIQNPLNFVNNFSEMSVELANELKEEAEKPEIDKELIIDLANDLSQNQAKINHHGKRASSIVSGMLEHSKASTGERALTDLNKLADEYLRLSYHGIRAKDSNFNSDYQTDFDENLPKIEVIPQDMGRVLLNLINNAFWAVKTVEKPLVMVKTEQSDNQLIIKVIDNGIGMTDEIKAKIFQPFFTTKPTGQGTGLGLSLAYDIVTKGHGGTIEVDSVKGEGTTFVVKLPI